MNVTRIPDGVMRAPRDYVRIPDGVMRVPEPGCAWSFGAHSTEQSAYTIELKPGRVRMLTSSSAITLLVVQPGGVPGARAENSRAPWRRDELDDGFAGGGVEECAGPCRSHLVGGRVKPAALRDVENLRGPRPLTGGSS